MQVVLFLLLIFVISNIIVSLFGMFFVNNIVFPDNIGIFKNRMKYVISTCSIIVGYYFGVSLMAKLSYLTEKLFVIDVIPIITFAGTFVMIFLAFLAIFRMIDCYRKEKQNEK